MKMQLQAEASECGLASLAMIADHHGLAIGLAEVRRRFPLSLKGATLARLMDAAGRLGFTGRPLRLELEDLGRLRLPCILHWDLNHFVVLARAGRRKATILDPARGRRSIAYDEVSEHFTGVALELTPAAGFEPAKATPTISIRQLTGQIRGLWRGLGLLLLLSATLQLFVVIGPFFLQWVVDQVLVSADRNLLAVIAIGFGLVLLLRSCTAVLRGWAILRLSTRLGLQWTGWVASL